MSRAQTLATDIEAYLRRQYPATELGLYQQGLWEIARRVNYSLLLPEEAAQASGGGPSKRVWARLRHLANSGVCVIVLGNRQSPTGLSRKHDGIINANPSNPKELRTVLEGLGLRYNHLLMIDGAPGASTSSVIMEGLRVDLEEDAIEGRGMPLELLPPFSISPDEPLELEMETSRVRLPVVVGRDRQSGERGVLALLARVIFAPRINIAESSHLLASGGFSSAFEPIAQQAHRNRGRALRAIRSRIPEVAKQALDQRSGAVCFRVAEWDEACQAGKAPAALVGYFNAILPHYWTPDRPCKQRVLYTSTKVLLRGEQYYENMRNVSPLERIRSMWSEMDTWSSVASKMLEGQLSRSPDSWKMVLGFLDQSRSIALQTFQFVHAAPPLLGGPGKLRASRVLGSEASGVHGFVAAAVEAYYAWLTGRVTVARRAVERTIAIWGMIKSDLTWLRRQVGRSVSRRGVDRRFQGMVRRWREADHPGENLLTAQLAYSRHGSLPRQHAVGIGWGGIELPLVYRFIARRLNRGQAPLVHIAQWSHYRDRAAKIAWYSYPGRHAGKPSVMDEPVVLFDDNVTTGLTLENVRDELVLEGAAQVHIFVTRFSGERRLAHMRMQGHGVVDPAFLLGSIGGYIGETPFARSWSREPRRYESPIGVFSLARRRILECIHNNSTVELYDREGF